jgi:NTE family protein
MRVGLVYDLGHARTIIGATPAPGQFRSGGFYTRFAVDTLDNVHFPRSGGYAGGVFGLIRESLGADASYELMYALAGHTFTFGENTLLAVVSGQTIWGSSGTITDLAHLGGFQRLSGFDRYQLAGRHSLLARVSAYRRVAVPGALSFSYPVYAGFSVEGGNVSQARDDLLDDVIAAGSVFVGMETPLGPLYFGYGHAEGDHGSFYLYLGRTF